MPTHVSNASFRCLLLGLHRIGISHFKEDVLPSISGNDVVVVVLGVGEDTTVEVEAVCRDAASRGAHLAVVAMSCASDQLTSTPRWQTNLPRPAVAAALQLARVDLLPNTGSLADLSMKMLLNVVSSGMQVPCGCVQVAEAPLTPGSVQIHVTSLSPLLTLHGDV